MRCSALAWLALSMAFGAGCAASGEVALLVDVRTDFRPVDEFQSVRTELVVMDGRTEAANTRTASASRTDDFTAGVRVAEYRVSSPLKTLVRATLLDASGSPVAMREIELTVHSNFAVTIPITRNCRDVTCPGAHDAASLTQCFGGRCVDPSCRPDMPATCGTPACSADADCARPVQACVTAQCIDGACFAIGHDDRCAMGQWCSPDMGCVARIAGDAGPPHDAGPFDAGHHDAGTPFDAALHDAGPFDAGPAPVCQMNHADCNHVASDGCEADLTEPAHCGTCTNTCAEFNPYCRVTALGPACTDQCHNGVRDGVETDIDCGGGTCPACPAGLMCHSAADCDMSLACNSGHCGCTGECVPGQMDHPACGMCGTQTRMCGSDCRWGTPTACTGAGPCMPSMVDTVACGMCGTQARTCGADCQWGSFSSCGGEGVCVVGTMQTQPCGMCGMQTRTCSPTCAWGAWGACTGQGVCAPSAVDTQPCGNCGTASRTCSLSCTWNPFGACTGQGPCAPGSTDATGCATCSARSCSGTCQWASYCDSCSCSASTICGTFCPSGFHPTRYMYSSACGGSCCSNNQVTCAPNCGGAYTQCGTFCPSGYHATRYDYNSSCGGSCCSNNESTCAADQGASFSQCGTFCPSGYAVSALRYDSSCGSSCCSNNAATCIRVGG